MSHDAGKLFILVMPDQRLPILQHGHRIGQLARHALSLMSVRAVGAEEHMPIMTAKAKNGIPGRRNDRSDGRMLNGQADKVHALTDNMEPSNITPDKEVSGPDNNNSTPSPASNVALSSSDTINSADETAWRRKWRPARQPVQRPGRPRRNNPQPGGYTRPDRQDATAAVRRKRRRQPGRHEGQPSDTTNRTVHSRA